MKGQITIRKTNNAILDVSDDSDSDDDGIIIKKNNIDYVSQSSSSIVSDKPTDFDNFLAKHLIYGNSKEHTHATWMGHSNWKFYKISGLDYEKFIDLYSNHISSNGKFGKLVMLEKPKDVGYLCLDFDLKQKNDNQLYNEKHLTDIVKIINHIVTKFYKVKTGITLSLFNNCKSTNGNNNTDNNNDNNTNDNDNNTNDNNDDSDEDSDYETDDDEENNTDIVLEKILQSYVCAKNKIAQSPDKKTFINGFHIQYPNLILDYKDRYFIYDELCRLTDKNGTFSDIKPHLHQPNDIIDKSVIISNKWYMYGSGKIINDDIYFYVLKHIYDKNAIDIKPTPQNASNKVLAQTLATRKSIGKTVVHLDNDIMALKLKEITEKYCKSKDDDTDFSDITETNNNDNNTNNTTGNNNNGNNNNKKTPLPKIESLFTNYTNPNLAKNVLKKEKQNVLIEDDDMTENNKKLEEIDFVDNKTKDNKLIEQAKLSKQDKDILMAKKLVKILSPERSVPYYQWNQVCWALQSISETLYPEFIEFSKLCPKKFNISECKAHWDRMRRNKSKRKATIGCLHVWASEDNNDKYNDVISHAVQKYIEDFDLSDFDIANILYIRYGNEYKCSSIKNKSWWHFNGVKWEEEEEGYSLFIRMSTEVTVEFVKLKANYSILKDAAQGIMADVYKGRIDMVTKIISKLKKNSYKNSIMAECKALFYHFNFERLLDSNLHLVGFENGVYDLSDVNNLHFRKTTPDDYISTTVGYDYNMELTMDTYKDNEVVKKIHKFFASIQPTEDMRKYLWMYCASFLKSGNDDQKFLIFTGSGSNGKSILTMLIKNSFNAYYGTAPIQLITKEKGSASDTDSAMADKKAVKILTMEEPETGAKIFTSYIKLLTGGTEIMTRGLYKNATYFTPQFKLLISCNDKPNIVSSDNGTWRRIRLLVFSQSFVDAKDYDPTKPNQQLKDLSLKYECEKWGSEFIWLLINVYYKEYAEHGLDFFEPEGVKLATNSYKQDSNVFMEFFDKCMVKDANSKLLASNVHSLFSTWHQQLYGDVKIPSCKKLIEHCIKIGCTVDGSTYINGFKQNLGNNMKDNIQPNNITNVGVKETF